MLNAAIVEEEKYVNYYVKDISEQKKMTLNAELSLTRMTSLLENLYGAVIIENENNEVILHNERVGSVFGVKLGSGKEQMAPTTKDKIFTREVISDFFQIPNATNDFFSDELKLRNGKTYRREFIPVYVKEQYRGCLWKFNDITKQKEEAAALIKAKTVAEKALEFKSNFLSNMSHEIRTPMSGIIGMAQLLKKSNILGKDKEYVDHIISCSSNLLTIINDILDLSKIESEKMTLEKTPLNIKEVCQSAISNVKYLLLDKNVEMNSEFNLMAGSEVILGDPVRLNQIITNLLSNAIKFTEQGSVRMTVRTRRSSTNKMVLELQVEDTGIGISKLKLEDVFKSFLQAEIGTTRNFGGTGLGLPICKMLVELHGGQISVASKLGKGSVFSVSIPCNIPFEKVVFKKNKEDTGLYVHDMNILVVDDSPINLLYTEEILTSASNFVTTACNGKEAVKLAAVNKYDVIFMDVQMPEMDGLDATKYLRSVLNIQTPIVAFTANVMKGEEEKYLSAGMTQCLSKPYYEQEIFAVIRQCLDVV